MLDTLSLYILLGVGVSAVSMYSVLQKLPGNRFTPGAIAMLLIVTAVIIALWPMAVVALLFKLATQP